MNLECGDALGEKEAEKEHRKLLKPFLHCAISSPCPVHCQFGPGPVQEI